jgi:hypothetical protein
LLSIRSANKEYMCFNITLLFHILLLELHVLLIRMKNISSNNFSMNLKIYETLWKESLNSDGHQFHLYQQNVQSSLILTELTEHKKTTTCDIGNPCSFKEYITFLNRSYFVLPAQKLNIFLIKIKINTRNLMHKLFYFRINIH